MPRPRICYTAIFKNESKNVYRCLNALKKIIDYVCICDTGSTDNTVELINKWGEENKIPTRVHHGPDQIFKNFGYNRTLSYKKAVETFPSADYLLLIDADMVVKIEDKFDLNTLVADAYCIEQVDSRLRYWNVRLIAAKHKWECIGVTHEYWSCKKEGFKTEKLKDIWIDDIGDGGSKENKFKRDVKLLTDGLNDESTPEDLKGRYKFYLANSYKDSGDPEKAIEWYEKKIAHPKTWIEETYYSYLNMGRCYLALKNNAKAAEAFLLAWQNRITRAESLYELSKMYRESGHHHLAMLYAEKGYEIPYPKTDSLFIDYNVYEYLFIEEISIAGFFTGDKGYQKGKACLLKLLKMKDKIPKGKYELALSNAKYYKLDESLIKKLIEK